MKKTLLVIFALALLFSCRTITPVETNNWLEGKQNAVAGMNIAGKWDAGPYMEGGWGEGAFTQVGNKISGTLGPYNVTGIVEGKSVFLAMQGGTKLYTAKLTLQPDGRLAGTFVNNALIGEESAAGATEEVMAMKRMN